MKRNATAIWKGTGKEGSGHISTQSPTLKNAPYAYGSRFENGSGTNPEELLAAAHAGCFTMKLSFNLTKAGFTPDNLETTCTIELDPGKGEITSSQLQLKAKVAGLDDKKFQELVDDAKMNCPVSKLFKTNITCNATLEK
jgi:lipoyl-dependent peroxiredoxin